MTNKQTSEERGAAAADKPVSGRSLSGAFQEISILTAISRLFGFIRDLVFAHILGAGAAADAFLLAFKLPNLFRRLTAEGAMTNAFLPAFSHLRQSSGRSSALLLAAEVQILLLVVLSLVVVVAEFFMPAVIMLLAPGFADQADRFEAAVTMARFTFPYLPMISLVALWAAITNAHDRFFGGAAAPIIMNLALIGGAVMVPVFTRLDGQHLADNPALLALPVAISVIFAGICQMLLMQRMLGKIGARPKWVRPHISPAGRKMWRAFLPAAMGAGGLQLNLLVDTILASFLPVGSIAWLYYGDRVAQLPLGVIGIALGTALLPRLSRIEAEGKPAEIAGEIEGAMRLAAFFALPCALAVVMIAEPIIGGLFGRGAFRATDVSAAAGALAAYGIGIPAFVFMKVMQPAFYAAGQAGTVLRISLVAVLINIVASLALMQIFAHVGLALATSLSAYCVLAIQIWLLYRSERINKMVMATIGRPLIASLFMALMLYILAVSLPIPTSLPYHQIWQLIILVGGGGLAYLSAGWYLSILPAGISARLPARRQTR